MEQTAVEWYAEQAMQLEIQRARSIISISQMLNELSNIFEQAKAMEKEQKGYSKEEVNNLLNKLLENNMCSHAGDELIEQFKKN